MPPSGSLTYFFQEELQHVLDQRMHNIQPMPRTYVPSEPVWVLLTGGRGGKEDERKTRKKKKEKKNTG